MYNVWIYLNFYKGIKFEYDYNIFNIWNLYISIGLCILFCMILIDCYVLYIYVKLYKCIRFNGFNKIDGYLNFLDLKSWYNVFLLYNCNWYL